MASEILTGGMFMPFMPYNDMYVHSHSNSSQTDVSPLYQVAEDAPIDA